MLTDRSLEPDLQKKTANDDVSNDQHHHESLNNAADPSHNEANSDDSITDPGELNKTYKYSICNLNLTKGSKRTDKFQLVVLQLNPPQ